MKTFSFKAEVDKADGPYGGRTYQPKGFYYQGNKKYIVLVGSVVTDDTVRKKILTKHVKLTISEDK